MAEILKITKGQPFALFVPCVILNTDGTKEAVEADTLTNIQVSILQACDTYACDHHLHDHFIVLDLPADLPTGEFAAVISATLPSGRPFSLRIKRAFATVEWDYLSNWRRYLIGDNIVLDDTPLIAGDYLTDAELETLKAEYRQKISEAEAARAEAVAEKERYTEAIEQLDDYATESNATANKQEILSAIAAIDPYVELTDEEIDSIAEPDTSTEETTEENEQSNEETTNE